MGGIAGRFNKDTEFEWPDPPEQIQLIEKFGKLEVKDGDIVVIKHSGHLSERFYGYIVELVEKTIRTMGVNCKCIILEEGMDIGILTKQSNTNS